MKWIDDDWKGNGERKRMRMRFEKSINWEGRGKKVTKLYLQAPTRAELISCAVEYQACCQYFCKMDCRLSDCHALHLRPVREISSRNVFQLLLLFLDCMKKRERKRGKNWIIYFFMNFHNRYEALDCLFVFIWYLSYHEIKKIKVEKFQ